MDWRSLVVGTRARVKNKAGDVVEKTVGNKEKAFAREEEVCARRVDLEQSLFITSPENRFPPGRRLN